MKAQWMKRIKKIAVFILTAAILINAVDCSQLFVRAETVEDAGENSGNESNLNSGAGEDANVGDDGSSGETGDSGEAGDDGSSGETGDSGEAGDTDIAGDGESAGDEAADTGSTGSESDGENESGNAGNSEGAGTEAGDGTGDSGNVDNGTGDESSPEEDNNGKIPADASVSGNDIPADTVVGTMVTVNVTNSDGDAVTGATVKFTETDTGNVIDFTEGSNGAYTAELSAAGNISISANDYVASNQSYENDGTSSFDIKLTGKYSYTVEITGSEFGSVTLNGKDVTGTFKHYKSSLPLVIKAKNHGYICSASIGGNTITLANNAEQEQTVADGETLSVNFAPLCATTITKTGEGTVYTASDTSTDLSGNTLYYLPNAVPSAVPALTVKANEGWYIDSVQNGETEAIASNVFTDEFSVTPDEGKNLTVVFKKKWTQDGLIIALKDANSFLESATYKYSYDLHAPESENADYSYSWSIGNAVSGVSITENKLVIPRNAAGTSFEVKVKAFLERENSDVVATFIVTPEAIAAEKGKDYVFDLTNDWIKAITVKSSEKNNFSNYELTINGNTIKGSCTAEGTGIDLGKVETSDATLTLKGTENEENYWVTRSGLKIDTKAPTDLALTYEEFVTDTDKKEITFDNGTYRTNKKIVITASAKDNGSKLTGTKAVLTYEGGELEESFDSNGIAVFQLKDGKYDFKTLTVMDVAGNTTNLENINTSISVDTAPPDTPEVTEANDTWRAGSQLDYSLSSSSEDVVKFVICEDSGSVVWENIEAEVLKGNTPAGVKVLDSIGGTAKWKFEQEGNVLNKSYQLKAMDGHNNFSVDAAKYTVKIDNEAPVMDKNGIKFTKADTTFELSLDSTDLQKINANVKVTVTGITDNTGSGVSKVALANGKEDNAEETKLIYDDENQALTATVEFTEQKDYHFKELRIYDKVGNCYKQPLNVNFDIDTTRPDTPAVDKENDTWRAGSQLDYSLSSSEDVVKFVICEDSGSVDWGNIETEVLKGNTPDGVEVLNSADGTVKWKFTQEGNVLNKSYQLKAMDGHNNFSVDAAKYTVKIDNEAPVIAQDGIKFTKKDTTFELSLDSTDLQKINANVKVTVTGITDNTGSGVSKVALANGKEDNAEETKLIYDDENQALIATVEFTEQKDYHFKELRIYDKMGNCYKQPLNVNFDIDTTRPDTPAVDKANDTWRAGSQLDYSLSSSEDVVKFVICENSGSVVWENIEADVLKGNTPAGVKVLDSIGGTAKWKFEQEGNVLNKSYQIKAMDGHNNFSENAATYTVKIDNEAPVIAKDGIKFTKKDTTFELSLDSTDLQKINANVIVTVTGITDNTGSGVSKVALANGKEDNAEETKLIYDDENQALTATVEFTEQKDYHFKELRIYDKVGNCYKEDLDVNFKIDTSRPEKPTIELIEESIVSKEEEGGWIKGTNCTYTISSESKDTVCFEIYSVNDAKQETLYDTLDVHEENVSDNGVSVNWEIHVEEEEVFVSTYKIVAKDCSDDNNANVSDPADCTVKIDNRKPVVDDAIFTDTKNKTELIADDNMNVAVDSSVTVQVNKVEDKEENYEIQVGLESVMLSFNVEIREGIHKKNNVKTVKFTLPPDKLDGTEATWELPGEAGKYCKYSNFVITAIDKLGNTTVNDESLKGYTVEIDQRGPVIKKVEWNRNSSEKSYWFNGDKNEHKFIVEAEDDTALKKITIFALDEQGNKTASLEKDFTGNEKTATVDFGAWIYDREGGKQEERQSYPDKKERYTIEVTDRFDNTTAAGSESEDFSEDPAPREVRIDKTLPVIKGAADNNAVVTYNFSNIKAPNAENVPDGQLTEEDHLVNGVLLSKEDVTVTVNAFDPKMDQNGENPDGVASGITMVELLVETEGKAPKPIKFTKETPNLEDEYEYEFKLEGTGEQETIFILKAIRLTDLAGNVKEYTYEDGEQADGKLGALTVVVDHKKPEADFTIEGYTYENQDGLTGWCSATEENPLKLTASASDGYGIKSIDWYRTTFEKGRDVAEFQPFENEINPSEAVTAFQNTLKLVPDQDQLYAVKVTDWAGNEDVFCNNTAKETGSRVRIDNKAPQNYALIHWEGDHNSSFNDIENEYEVSQKGYVYNKNKVTLSVLVRDGLVTGLLNADENGKVCSDIERVEVTINNEDSSEKKVVRNSQKVRIVEVEGETYLEFKFEGIELTAAEGSEVEKYLESIVICDYAGNQTPAEGELLSDEIKYVLDSRAPKLTIDYHDGSYVESALFPETFFYKEDPSVNATIEERYFYSEDVKANLSEPEAADTLNQSEWSMGSVEHSSVFSASSDGKYRFSLEYMDRSGNEMTGEEVSNGKYISKYLVMDTTVPKIEITYEHNGQDVTDEIYDGNFFAGTVKATVRIHEMNFDPDMVEIEATGKNSESNAGIGIGWDGGWIKESEEVNVNTVTFEQQGTYQFTCSCKDIVGHDAERPAQSHFVVDTTKPEVEITYDLNDPLNEKYYKEARTATVHVTDRSFDPEQVEFLIETSSSQPAISEWTYRGGAGCEDQPTYHVDGCVYEATVAFAEDGDYSLGFSCVDKAGNESDVVMTDLFTVDQTVPEMLVTYDNNDVQNEYYYKEQRIGTVTITEHNFNPEDVQIVTTAQNTDAAAPGISGWRNEGDVHTTTIAYSADADYTFDISYSDMAGNEAEVYGGDRFVVDTTVPVLAITDIEDKSANNGTVAPGIEWSDINLDTDGVFMLLTGANNGEVTVATAETVIEGGMKIQYQDFPHEKGMDDLYTFHATVADLAGNVSEETVMFSVNRFGSVYVFDDVTQDIVDHYYINKPARLNVTEINVDTLEFKEITYSKDGDIVTMKAGEDYAVMESGTETTWKSYTYDIYEDNFEQEGAYAVTIYSEDRATNKSNNIVKEKVIDFVMDTTVPTVVVTGVDNEEQYNENSRTITIDAKDNIFLAGVTAYLNDQPVQTFDEETLLQNGGVVTMEIGSSNEWQTLVIRAIDAAGNEGSSDTRVFLITRNVLVQWYRNVPLFWGSIIGLTVLAALIIFFLFWKKKKEEEKAA